MIWRGPVDEPATDAAHALQGTARGRSLPWRPMPSTGATPRRAVPDAESA